MLTLSASHPFYRRAKKTARAPLPHFVRRLLAWLPEAPESEQRARSSRLIITLLQAPLLANFIGWWTLLWFALVALNEFVINGAISKRFIAPFIQSDFKRSTRNWTALIVWGAFIYSWGWAYAWMSAGPAVSFLAPLWLATSCIHGLTYFSDQRPQFMACVSAPAIACFIMPLTFSGDGLPAWCALLAMSQFMVTIFLSFRDRHQLVRALLRTRAETKAAKQSNVAKSQFLATMSHELRTPLNAVIGYAEILEEDLGGRDLVQGADDAARITRAARHLLEMINEILDLSKIEAGKFILSPAPTNVSAILAEVTETVAHLVQRNGNTLTLSVSPDVQTIVMDGPRFRQCALNFVSNACKFTRDGRVDVRAWIETVDGAQRLRLDVQDTGAGISEDMIGALFQPFVQADTSSTRQHEGTGLGLAITRKLIQLMGGDVSVTSTLNVGSTFSLWAPATREAASQPIGLHAQVSAAA